MIKTLVIGNGFDLAHGLPTSWKDFREYLFKKIEDDKQHVFCSEKFKNKLYEYSEELSDLNFWSDVEGYLGNAGLKCGEDIEVDALISFIDEFTLLFQKYLIKVESEIFPKILVNQSTVDFIDGFDKIITTNYTNTLEKIYGIDSSKIKHIHGQITDISDKYITCIIGCDNSTFKEEQLKNVSPRKISIVYKENPSYLCDTNISKLGKTMSFFNTSQFMTDNSLQYDEVLNNIKVINSEEIYFWGYSFGKSDFILNEVLLKRVEKVFKPNVFVSSTPKFISYSVNSEQRQLNDEIQELVEDKLGYNSKLFSQIILFSEDYIEKSEEFKLM